jgi:hypothetical protein
LRGSLGVALSASVSGEPSGGGADIAVEAFGVDCTGRKGRDVVEEDLGCGVEGSSSESSSHPTSSTLERLAPIALLVTI